MKKLENNFFSFVYIALKRKKKSIKTMKLIGRVTPKKYVSVVIILTKPKYMNRFWPFGYDTKITIICNPKISGPEEQIKGHIMIAFSDFLLSNITLVSPTDLFGGDVCCSGKIFLNACDFFH